jgi:acetyl esterase/lipase
MSGLVPNCRRLATGAALAVSMFALSALLAQSSTAQDATMHNIVFVSDAEHSLSLDLYLPPTAAAPLVIYVHGGAWRSSDKSAGRDFAAALAAEGFAVASLDFRQSTQAPFPANVHDIKAGIRFLRAHASDYGYDATRIALAGESSGAHLALVAGLSKGNAALEGTVGTELQTSSEVQAILAYYPATDLTTILAQSTPFGLSLREPSLQLLLGGLPDERPELARLASPVSLVTAEAPPLYLLHGDRDPQMPVNQSLQLWGVYKELGLDVSFVPVHGGVHGGAPFFTAGQQAGVVAFLRRTLQH